MAGFLRLSLRVRFISFTFYKHTYIHFFFSFAQSQNPREFLHGTNSTTIKISSSSSSQLSSKMHKPIQIQEPLLHWSRPELTKHWIGPCFNFYQGPKLGPWYPKADDKGHRIQRIRKNHLIPRQIRIHSDFTLNQECGNVIQISNDASRKRRLQVQFLLKCSSVLCFEGFQCAVLPETRQPLSWDTVMKYIFPLSFQSFLKSTFLVC